MTTNEKNHIEIEFDLQNPIIQYKYANKRSKGNKLLSRKKTAVMVAGVCKEHPEHFTVGFALCDPRDKFDFITLDEEKHIMRHEKNFGRNMALRRAKKWANPNVTEVPYEYTLVHNRETPLKINGIPPKLMKAFPEFVERVQRYYKNKKPMPWIETALSNI